MATDARINGRYRILELLGTGSQGSVYRVADQLYNGALRALKCGVPNGSPVSVETEFETLQGIRHPHLARVFDCQSVTQVDGVFSQPPGSLFVTEELIEGIRVDEYVRRISGPDLVRVVGTVGIAIARALQMLHSRGVLHLDVKPSNILVGENESLMKLIDLGLSRPVDRMISLRVGTPGYMAPEAYDGFPDRRSDIYSLGKVLQELITGIPPSLTPGFRVIWPEDLDTRIVHALEEMTAIDPEQRTFDVTDVIRLLGRAFGPELLGTGRGDEILNAYSIVDDRSTRRALARSTAFVGRQQELHILNQILTTEYAECPVCIVAGAPGIGKTRLIAKAVATRQMYLAREHQMSLTCVSSRLSMLVRILTNGVLLPAGIRGPLSTWLTTISGPPPHWISLRVMTCLCQALSELRAPTVVHLENADVHTVIILLQALSEIGSSLTGIRVIVETDTVPSGLDLFPNPPQVVRLTPLTVEEEAEMVCRTLGAAMSSDVAVARRRRTGGNPRCIEMFLEECASSFGKATPGISVTDMVLDVVVSETELVERILATVLSDMRDVLMSVFAAGGTVSREMLCGITNVQEDAIDEICLSLRNAGLLYREDMFLSLTGFLRRGMQNCVSRTDLSEYSRRAYAVLSGNDDDDLVATMAMRAGLLPEAASRARRAANRYRREGRYAEARRALKMLLDSTPKAEKDAIWLELAAVCRRLGNYEESLALLESLDHREEESILAAALERGACFALLARTEEAETILEPLTQCRYPAIRLEAVALCARMKMDRGDMEAASVLLIGIQQYDETLLDHTGLLQVVGFFHLTCGDMIAAEAIFRKGLEVARGMGNPAVEARYHAYLGMVAHAGKEWATAAEAYQSAYLLADESGDRHGTATYVVNYAAALTEMDEVESALVAYRDGMIRLQTIGRFAENAQASANYAQLLLRVGDTGGAHLSIRQALSHARKSDNPLVLATVLSVEGEVLLNLEQLEASRQSFEEAAGIFRGMDRTTETGHCYIQMSDICLRLNHPEDGAANLEMAISCDPNLRQSTDYAVQRILQNLQTNEDPRNSLVAVRNMLPSSDTDDRWRYYLPLCAAAFASERVGDAASAGDYAARALRLIHRMRQKTPALHRPGDYRFETRLYRIDMNRQSTGEERMLTSSVVLDATRLTWLERIIRITARLNSELDLDSQLNLIIDAAIDITGAERGFVLMMSESNMLEAHCCRGMAREHLQSEHRNYSRSVAERAVETGEILVTTDAQEDVMYQDSRSIAALSLRCIVAVPLQMKGVTEGAVYLDSRTGGRFDAERLNLLQVLSDQAAIAINNARMVRRLQENSSTIADLNRQLTLELETTQTALHRVESELRDINEDLARKHAYHGIIARSRVMTDLFRTLDRIAKTDIPVVISGESGTGKELIARALHVGGDRRKGPFVAESCAAIPPSLLESILFGHVRGAFTGAVANRPGLFVEAHGGSLLLDEIGELPMEMQSKLLRILQEGEVRPVGGSRPVQLDVRVIVATNRNLADMVHQGRFREDLYYRLNVMEVCLPPLRSRIEDIPVLVRHFIEKHQPGRNVEIARDAMAYLLSYSWPGNVRQLENEVARALVLCDDILELHHLSDRIRNTGDDSLPEETELEMNRHLDQVRRRLIREALRQSQGNKSVAARLLGLSRFGLAKMMERLEMASP